MPLAATVGTAAILGPMDASPKTTWDYEYFTTMSSSVNYLTGGAPGFMGSYRKASGDSIGLWGFPEGSCRA